MAQPVDLEAARLAVPRRWRPRFALPPARHVVAVLALTSLSPPLTASDDLDAPTRNWRSGPVRYLLTLAEDQAYKRPHTEEERAAFIRAFWARRDPTPGTLRNEFREQFVERLQATPYLRRYQDISRSQWLTDMGKIFILLGPPVSEDHQQMSDSTRDVVVWGYDRVPGVRARNFALAFVADESGELRLSDSPTLDMATIQGLDPHTPFAFFEGPTAKALRDARKPDPDAAGRSDANMGGLPPSALAGDPLAVRANVLNAVRAASYGNANTFADMNRYISGQGSLLSLGPFEHIVTDTVLADPFMSALGRSVAESDLDRLTSLATVQADAMRASRTAVAVSTSFQPLRVDLRTDFYAAADGTTYAAFTLAPSGRGTGVEARWLPFGGLVDIDHPGVEYSFAGAGQFAAAGVGAPDTFQTGLGIDPGRYRALFGLHDLASGRIGYREVELTVPDLGAAGLALSSLTLARSIAPVESTPSTPWKLAYVFGGLRVVPRPDPTLRNGEELHVFYQVYGASSAAGGHTDLALRYRFARWNGEVWEDVGRPLGQQGTTPVQTLSFPLQHWPPGIYRLTVEVRDQRNGALTAGELVFSVAAGLGC